MPEARAEALVVVLNPSTRKISSRFLPTSAGGDSGIEFLQPTPLATWTIPHELERRPNVTIFSSTGEEVEADVTATSTQVSISFPVPFSGSAVLT